MPTFKGRLEVMTGSRPSLRHGHHLGILNDANLEVTLEKVMGAVIHTIFLF